MTLRLVIQASASSGSNVDTAPQRRRAGFFKARMALSNLEEYVVSQKIGGKNEKTMGKSMGKS